MYTEEPRREINWGKIIKKGAIVLLIAAILFLIVWLFTRNNNTSNRIEVNNGNETYSEIFINNYHYLHDTMKDYFLTNKLPEDGKTIKFTLQELFDRELILPFGYKDNTTCDNAKSYVSITNKEGTYQMTTTLICGNETSSQTEFLKCNNLCNDNDCKIEYEYKQPYTTTETTYSCPSGYTKKDNKCVKKTTNTIEATKNINEICPLGYTKKDNKCVKITVDTIDATLKNSYSCPSNYALYETANSVTCKRIYTSYYNASVTTKNSCPSGYTEKDNKCVKISSTTVDAKETTTYTCDKGELSGNKCIITETIDATPKKTYTCPSGYSENGNICIKFIYEKYSYGLQHPEYSNCTGGQYINNPCNDGSCSTGSYVYKCTTNTNESETYTCPSGYSQDGKTCTKTTKVDAKETTIYTCDKGKLNGSKCIVEDTKTTNLTSNKVYSCNKGDTLTGTLCKTTTTSIKTPTISKKYTCPTTYTLDGTKCTTNKEDIVSLIKETTYTCPKDYIKSGVGTTSICIKEGVTSTIDATESKKQVTKYRYQWSTATSIAGWEKTGKTR